jgi:hypothetical protein
MPHARHGGNGVFAFASAGSKFEGTGFEKEHMGHIHVAVVAGWGAGTGGGGDIGVLARGRGDEVPLPDDILRNADDRFGGLR